MQYTPEENAARREALYNFLLQRGDKWTSMEETTDSISEYPAFFKSNYHNSQARRMLTRDIEAINDSEDFRKIIISGNRGIKLADELEYERFIRAEKKEIFRKLARVRKIIKKGSKDQQITLENEIEEPFIKKASGADAEQTS